MERVLGFDLGFGHTKVIWEKGKLKFPTWIAYKSNNPISEIESVSLGTEEYVIGRDAAREPRKIEISSIDTLISFAPYFLEYAIQKAKIHKENLFIITGVPPIHKERKEELRNYIIKAFPSVEVEVVIQGMGILADMEEKLGNEALLLDIGYNTVDFLFVEREGKAWRYVKGNTIEDFGILRAVESFREKIPQELSYIKNFSLSRLNDIFEKGYVIVHGKKKELGDITELAKREYTKTLLSRLEREIGNLIYECESLVLGGGGAYLIDRNLLKHSNVLIPHEPEYSQARGYLRIGKFLKGAE